MMKKMIKTGITIVLAVGMLAMSLPTVAFAEEVAETITIDPNELLSEEELPEDAVIKDADDGEINVYRYDEDGKLVQVEPEFEDWDETGNVDTTTNEDSDNTEDPAKTGEQESYGPLTPDGNLTLIDDYGTETKAGKQFITVQTKSGAYFYLIIDRDDNGNESVHFLNQVDESDILKFLEEDEVKAYEERKTALDEKRAALEAEEKTSETGTLTPTPTTKPDQPEEKTQIKLPIELTTNSLMIVGAIVIVGIGAFAYMKIIKKKPRTVAKVSYEQDPDDWDDEKVDSELADVPDVTGGSDDE